MTDYVPRKSDIDFKRGKVCIAFLNNQDKALDEYSAVQEMQREQQFDLEAADDDANDKKRRRRRASTWRGVFGGLQDALYYSFTTTYAASRHFAHCEVCFFASPSGIARYGRDYMITCGAHEETGVRVMPRRFNEKYTWLYLNVSEVELKCVVDFVFAQNGKLYDTRASSKLFSNPRVTTGAKWYCSEIVMAALQLLPCATLQSRRPNCVDVDDVYYTAKRSSRRSESALEISPYQLKSAYATTATSDASADYLGLF